MEQKLLSKETARRKGSNPNLAQCEFALPHTMNFEKLTEKIRRPEIRSLREKD